MGHAGWLAGWLGWQSWLGLVSHSGKSVSWWLARVLLQCKSALPVATIWPVKYDQGLAGLCLSPRKACKPHEYQWTWAVQKMEVF
jgi:hypothetical protein